MAKTATAAIVVNPPQWVAESTEGTTPTASPSFTALGAVQTIALKINGNFVDISQIAAEDLVTIIQGQQEYETQYTLHVVNATSILNRLFNAYNYSTPTGTVNETVSILFSIPINGTTNYIICKGSRIKDGSITLEVGKPLTVTVTFTHTTISTPNSSHGLTTPTLVTAISGTVWGWLDGGTTPVTWNSSAIDCKKITVNINRNTKPDYTLGNVDPHSSQAHGRRISGDFATLWNTTTLETDFKAGTARTLAIVLKTATATLTCTSSKLVDYSRDTSTDSDEAIPEQTTFRCLSAAIA